MGVERRWRVMSCVGCCAVFGAWLLGCGGAGGDRLTPVAGKVTMGGAPLNNGSVTFHPDTAKGNNTPHIPAGTTDAQGNYKLKSATQEGVPLGWYKVTVGAQEPIDPQNPYAPPKYIVNPKFSDASTSGLAVQVTGKAAPGAYDFEVTK